MLFAKSRQHGIGRNRATTHQQLLHSVIVLQKGYVEGRIEVLKSIRHLM